MPKPQPNVPSPIVAPPTPEAPAELRHARTIAPGKEEYHLVWPSGHIRMVVSSDAELAEKAARGKAGKVKKKHTPGAERYERNPHEPIKC